MEQQEVIFRCQIPESEQDTQFEGDYASTLFNGGKEQLKERVLKLEKRIWPGFTAWCPECKKPCLIVRNASQFPNMAAHHINRIKTYDKLKEYKLLG